MSRNYSEIHAANADAYTAISNAAIKTDALAESGKYGDTNEMRKLYAKNILGNRIQPTTKAQIESRFLEAWTQQKAS